MAGGYTPARKKPVRKRRARAAAKPGATTSRALAAAAHSAEVANRDRAGTTSARLSSAAAAVPNTKPSWTTVVSQPACWALRPQSAWSCGATALAVNQSDIPSSSASESRSRIPQRRAVCEGSGGGFMIAGREIGSPPARRRSLPPQTFATGKTCTGGAPFAVPRPCCCCATATLSDILQIACARYEGVGWRWLDRCSSTYGNGLDRLAAYTIEEESWV